MPDRQFSFDVTRAVGILNVAMRNNQFAQGAIPESDDAKIMEAERIVAGTMQAKEIADAVGSHKVPNYQAILDILFEAQVLVGANGDGPLSPPTAAEPTPPVVSPELATQPADPAPTQPAVELDDKPKEKGEVWLDPQGGEWEVVRDMGQQVEVSTNDGEKTIVPAGFLKKMIKAAPPAPVADVVAHPDRNEVLVTHPGCTKWMYPLDDTALPVIGQQVECADCGQMITVRSVEANGYVQPTYEPPTPPTPDPEPEPEMVIVVQPKETPSASVEPPPSSERPTSTSEASSQSAATSGPSTEVDDDEGDKRYRELLDRVESDWSPVRMPVPADMETRPLSMPDDLTADDTMNRRLHSQFNALAGRARYLGGIERAKARDCGRVRKLNMTRAMREARAKLGNGATVTEVKDEAELDEDVSTWSKREAHHADKADAYRTFFEIYAENVKTLSRDLTWAGAEESGS